jgi:hypothetical protein
LIVPNFHEFKKALEEWARPERRAALVVDQDGEAHAVITVMGAGKLVGAPSQTLRVKFTEPNAIEDAETRVRGIIDDLNA